MYLFEYTNIDIENLFCYSAMLLLPKIFDIKPKPFWYFKPDCNSVKSQRLRI